MKWLLLLCLATTANAETVIRYWSGPHERAEFAAWAMETWARASDGRFRVEKVDQAAKADIRFRWVNPQRSGLYGQSHSSNTVGKPSADIIINPSMESLGPDMLAASTKDPLYGEVILFLTCVHEAGHALGPEHTRNYADIMYSFQYGGDFVAYFQRYRARLKTRADMPKQSPLSADDIKQIQAAAARWPQSETRSGAPAPAPPQ